MRPAASREAIIFLFPIDIFRYKYYICNSSFYFSISHWGTRQFYLMPATHLPGPLVKS